MTAINMYVTGEGMGAGEEEEEGISRSKIVEA